MLTPKQQDALQKTVLQAVPAEIQVALSGVFRWFAYFSYCAESDYIYALLAAVIIIAQENHLAYQQIATNAAQSVGVGPEAIATAIAIAEGSREHSDLALLADTLQATLLLAGAERLLLPEMVHAPEQRFQQDARALIAAIPHIRLNAAQTAAEQILVTARLLREENLRQMELAAKPFGKIHPYIIIEGISGSGKTTQAEMLEQRYNANGQSAVLLHEPSEWFWRQKRQTDGPQYNDDQLLFLLLADRSLHIAPTLQNYLAEDKVIIASRSFLSTIVYQSQTQYTAAQIIRLHQFMPRPARIIIFDMDPALAMERVVTREREQGRARNEYELLELLQRHRQKFREIADLFPFCSVIPVDTYSRDELHEIIWNDLQQYITT